MKIMRFDELVGQVLMSRSDVGRIIQIERDDGYLSSLNADRWINWSIPTDPIDEILLDQAAGPLILDVGCATGRHVNQLQNSCFKVAGIDLCEVMIQEAHRRGLLTCWRCDIWELTGYQFNEILLLGGNIGIAGHVGLIVSFLQHLKELLLPGGKVLLSSIDYTAETDPFHRRYYLSKAIDFNYPGDAKLRLRWNSLECDWFEWLRIDPRRLTQEAFVAGFDTKIVSRMHSKYAAILERNDSK